LQTKVLFTEVRFASFLFDGFTTIDFLYYKYVPRLVCLLICVAQWSVLHSQPNGDFLKTLIFEIVCFVRLGLIFVNSGSSELKSNQNVLGQFCWQKSTLGWLCNHLRQKICHTNIQTSCYSQQLKLFLV
jgi:hypothetical protein